MSITNYGNPNAGLSNEQSSILNNVPNLFSGATSDFYGCVTANTLQNVFSVTGSGFAWIIASADGAVSPRGQIQVFEGPYPAANKILDVFIYATDTIVLAAFPFFYKGGLTVLVKSDGTNSVCVQTRTIASSNQYVAALNPDYDTGIYSVSPTTNYDATTPLYILNNSSQLKKSLFHFDLSSIPSGATIISANLILKSATTIYYKDMQTNRIIVPWVSTETTWNEASTGTTWNTAGMGSGSDYEAAASTFKDISFVSGDYYSFDVSAMCRGWYDGTYDNYGVVLQTLSNNLAGGVAFDMSEDVTPTDRPVLNVIYSL